MVKMTFSKPKQKIEVDMTNYNLKVYVRDEPHYSGMSTRALAKVMINGSAYVPPRPFFQQFLAIHTTQIQQIIVSSLALGFKGKKRQEQLEIAGEQILDLFQVWLYSGGVTPENKPRTIELKGSSTPLVDTGMLMYAVTTSVKKKVK